MKQPSNVRTPVLDHGYVQLVESWGSDESIIEAARMSTSAGFKRWGGAVCPDCLQRGLVDEKGLYLSVEKWDSAARACKCKGVGKMSGDEKLLAYLYKHKHMTPFEMCGAVFEIKAPIFVFREWHRHRTQSYNEMSARYIPLPDENYLPGLDDVVRRSGTNANKQAAGLRKIQNSEAEIWLERLKDLYGIIEAHYQMSLNLGVPKELSRICLPVGRYSCMRASANLRNWMQFLELRCAPQAQEEIRQYAEAVQSTLEVSFPRTIALFRGNPR